MVMKQPGFDSEKYLNAQTEAILDRLKKFEGNLYLEFGGKICFDLHAARVLSGYDPENKIKLLKRLKDLEIIYCVSAKDLQKSRVRQDLGLTYDNQTIKTVDELGEHGLDVSAVVITRFEEEFAAKRFKRQLENLGVRVFLQTEMNSYPKDIDFIVSENGFGSQPYIPIKKKVIIVTGAGGGSGKMSFCLSQIYHEHNKGFDSGFAKFETFPIWNLPLDHPINTAYEAATADLLDENMIDTYHEKAYGVTAVNYNRDIENFAIMKQIFEKILGKENFVAQYQSPTDMGVNRAKDGIINDEICREAAKQEIIRRYFRYNEEYLKGIHEKRTVERMEELMKKAGVKKTDRPVVLASQKAAEQAKSKLEKGNKGIFSGAAIELHNGEIVTGKNSPLLHAESAAVLNAVKILAGIPDKMPLLTKSVIENINVLKTGILNGKSESLNLDETLIALSVSSAANPLAQQAIQELRGLESCEMHTTHIPSSGDIQALRKLKINVTTDAIPTLKRYFS